MSFTFFCPLMHVNKNLKTDIIVTSKVLIDKSKQTYIAISLGRYLSFFT